MIRDLLKIKIQISVATKISPPHKTILYNVNIASPENFQQLNEKHIKEREKKKKNSEIVRSKEEIRESDAKAS